jgi:hypothetical protein
VAVFAAIGFRSAASAKRRCGVTVARSAPEIAAIRAAPSNAHVIPLKTHDRALAALTAPEVLSSTALIKTEGAGKAGCQPHPRSGCNKKHPVEPQVSRTSGLPCAMVLRLLRTLPGAPGFLATVTCAARERRRRFDTSVGVPGPYDLTVRADVVRPHVHHARPHQHVHRIPPRVS